MGFKVRLTEPLLYWEPDLDPNKIHINILELLAIIINIILAVCCMNRLPPPSSGWVLHARADNTSALSWTQYASRSKRIDVRLLTHFLSAFLTFSQAQVAFTLSLSHIAGVLNTGSDALSRPKQFPTWRSAINECEELRSLRAYRVPCELLSILALLTSEIPIKESYEKITNRLLQHAPRSFSTGRSGPL